jgi:hypothetical protein
MTNGGAPFGSPYGASPRQQGGPPSCYFLEAQYTSQLMDTRAKFSSAGAETKTQNSGLSNKAIELVNTRVHFASEDRGCSNRVNVFFFCKKRPPSFGKRRTMVCMILVPSQLAK